MNGSSGGSLPRAMQIGWGLGSLGPALVMSSFNLLMLRFMTDQLGIAAGLAGLLIAASKIYDAVTDPLTGVLSDRTRVQQRSRRRPWLLWGGAALALSYVLMFAVPALPGPNSTAIYMAVALLVYAIAYSTYNIPYMAMPAEMSQSYHERTALMTWRVAAVAVAGILANAVGLNVLASFGGGRAGYAALAFVLAPFVLLSAAWAWAATRDAPYTQRPLAASGRPLGADLRLIATNRPFLIVLGVKLLTLMMLGVGAASPFFFGRILEVSDRVLGLYGVLAQLSLLASQPLWLRASRRWGKRNALLVALALVSCVGLTWLPANAGDPAWHIYARAIGLGLGQGGVLLMGQALLPDTIEYDALRSGLRREGFLASLYTSVEKIAQALGVALVGGFLSYMGYVASAGGVAQQPESALLAIRLSVGAVPAMLCGLSLLLMLAYDLSEARLAALREQNARDAVAHGARA